MNLVIVISGASQRESLCIYKTCLLYRSDLFFVNVYFSPSSVKESYYLTSENVYVSQNYSRAIILEFNFTKFSALMDKKVIKIIFIHAHIGSKTHRSTSRNQRTSILSIKRRRQNEKNIVASIVVRIDSYREQIFLFSIPMSLASYRINCLGELHQF